MNERNFEDILDKSDKMNKFLTKIGVKSTEEAIAILEIAKFQQLRSANQADLVKGYHLRHTNQETEKS